MVLTLLSHSLKKFRRSVSFSKDLATTIFLAFFSLMILGYMLALGFFLDDIMVKGLQKSDPVAFLHSVLIYYFFGEFLVRYLVQSLPVFDIQPYLHLPIRKNNLIHYMLLTSVLGGMSLFVLVLLTPFAFETIGTAYGNGIAFLWIATLWLISSALHYLVILFKAKYDDTFWGMATLIACFSFIGVADYYGWFRLTSVSSFIFPAPEHFARLAVSALALLGGVYCMTFRLFRSNVYLDEFSKEKNVQSGTMRGLQFLNNFGATGDWIDLELKLIFRNKRTKIILGISGFFLLYGLIFYGNPKYTEEMPGFLLFVGTFVTGVFMMNYGQYLFSWQSSHFDFTLTRPISIRQYIESKYWLIASITFLCYLLTVPYVLFGWKILLVNTVMMLFNLGINIFVIMNLGMWSPKKLDMSKGSVFNIQGVGAAQWVMGIPIFLLPYVFYLPFSLAGYPMLGLCAIGLAGVTGIIFRPKLIALTTDRLLHLKHSIAEGFRK